MGIANLVTQSQEQGHGHGRNLVDAALADGRREGRQFSLLFTKEQEIFRDLGYVSIPIPEYEITGADSLSGREKEKLRKIREFRRSTDLSPVAALHGEYGARFSGVMVRSLGWWAGMLKQNSDPKEDFVVLEETGVIKGMVRAKNNQQVGQKTYEIHDFAASDEDSEQALLHWILERTQQVGAVLARGRAPHPDRVSQLVPAGTLVSFSKSADMMVKILDATSLIKALSPEFDRLNTLFPQKEGAEVTVQVHGEAITIQVRGDGIQVQKAKASEATTVRMSESNFWPLMLEGQLPSLGENKQGALLERLFPSRQLSFCLGDEF
tara:strand:+ start:808 stop:1776 length:969 start_codon:yes stop_codon:yes gene_type:complete